MAEGTKLVLSFSTNEDKTASYTFNYTKDDVTASQVKTLMNAMITNTSTYENTLTSMKSAKTVITSEVEYDLSA